MLLALLFILICLFIGYVTGIYVERGKWPNIRKRPQPGKWWCSMCKRYYYYEDIAEIDDHAKVYHPLKDTTCSVCGKVFKSNSKDANPICSTCYF